MEVKRAICLICTALLVLIAGCTPIAANIPPPSAAEVSEQLYRDRDGLFTVPVPSNWTAEQAEGYGVLASPDGQIIVYVLAIPATDLETAIDRAWEMTNPDFDLELTQIQEQAPTGGVEQAVFEIYDAIESAGRLAIASGQRHQDIVYLALVDADFAAFQRRSSHINIILTGLSIAALDRINLAGVEPLPFDEELQAELETYIFEAMERFQVPGAAVAIVQDGAIVYAQGFGVKELGTDSPVTPATKMMIGSTTKTFTTMLMAALVDEGLLEWETPVVQVLPEFRLADPEITSQTTVRNLVCNCTGVSRRDVELLFNAGDMSAEDVIASLATFEIFTGFGETYQYSNQMIAAGGYIAAAASGGEYGNLFSSYQQALQERVLDPIDMPNTTLTTPTARDDFAVPHGLDLSFTYAPIPLSQEEFVHPVAPAGGLWSTASDMARYLATALNRGVTPDGTRVVSTENLAATWEPQVPVSADTSYGLGWFVADYKGQPMFHHGGATIGFTSDLAFLPEAGLGISVLTNARASSLNTAVRYRLLELVFQQDYEYDDQAAFNFANFRDEYRQIFGDLTQVDPEAVTPYLGRYTNSALGDVTLELVDDALIMDAGEFQTELRPKAGVAGQTTQDLIAYNAPAMTGLPAQLTRDQAGKPILVFGQGVSSYRFQQID